MSQLCSTNNLLIFCLIALSVDFLEGAVPWQIFVEYTIFYSGMSSASKNGSGDALNLNLSPPTEAFVH